MEPPFITAEWGRWQKSNEFGYCQRGLRGGTNRATPSRLAPTANLVECAVFKDLVAAASDPGLVIGAQPLAEHHTGEQR
jgi:hypothetical protein